MCACVFIKDILFRFFGPNVVTENLIFKVLITSTAHLSIFQLSVCRATI